MNLHRLDDGVTDGRGPHCCGLVWEEKESRHGTDGATQGSVRAGRMNYAGRSAAPVGVTANQQDATMTRLILPASAFVAGHLILLALVPISWSAG